MDDIFIDIGPRDRNGLPRVSVTYNGVQHADHVDVRNDDAVAFFVDQFAERLEISSADMPMDLGRRIVDAVGAPIRRLVHDLLFDVAAKNGKAQRKVVIRFGAGGEHRECINVSSAVSRKQLFQRLADKLEVDADALANQFDDVLVEAANDADRQAMMEAEQQHGDGDDKPKQSQATVLVDLALASGAELFHDASGEAFATVPIGEHRETWRVRSKSCKLWLWRLYHQQNNKAPNAQAVADSLCVLESKALFDGSETAVHLRTAEHADKLYIDLCGDAWQVVEVDADGWRVVSQPPVLFRRAKAMLPLPIPRNGGKLDTLRTFINADDDGWALAAAWLVAAMRSRGPYPVLALHGEQGSGKSTQAMLLRSLVDPNSAPLRCEPREPRDLMISANNGWVVALDNLSYLPVWLSDCLCRLATGGGFSTRTLYENDDETIFTAQRPVIVTGIEEVATRGDLVDRSLMVHLPAIPESARRTEKELHAEFDAVRPMLFGALLSAVSTAMRRLPDVMLDDAGPAAAYGRLRIVGNCCGTGARVERRLIPHHLHQQSRVCQQHGAGRFAGGDGAAAVHGRQVDLGRDCQSAVGRSRRTLERNRPKGKGVAKVATGIVWATAAAGTSTADRGCRREV